MYHSLQTLGINLRTPINIQHLQLWAMRCDNLHRSIVDILHARHVDMEELRVAQEKEMYARAFNLATFDAEVLQVSALLVCHSCPQAEPLVSKLYAAAQVEVLDKRSSAQHDLYQGLRRDLLVV